MLLLSVLFVAAIMTGTGTPGAVEPPAEWLAEIARSNYLYSPNDALIKDNLKATIGNGQLATQIDANALYIAGVFNGPAAKPFSDRASAAADDDVSHRATVTSPLNVQCAESMTARFKPAGAALDLRGARYLRRSTAADGSGGVLEQRFFAHRTERGLLVLELANVGSAPITCTLVGGLAAGVKSRIDTKDIAFGLRSANVKLPGGSGTANVTVMSGRTRVSETAQTPTVLVALAVTAMDEISPIVLPPGATRTLLASVATSIDTADPEAAALAAYGAAAALPTGALATSSAKAWAQLWESGVAFEGRPDVAVAVNASLYYLLSSVCSVKRMLDSECHCH